MIWNMGKLVGALFVFIDTDADLAKQINHEYRALRSRLRFYRARVAVAN